MSLTQPVHFAGPSLSGTGYRPGCQDVLKLLGSIVFKPIGMPIGRTLTGHFTPCMSIDWW